jgi:hypothetical protein
VSSRTHAQPQEEDPTDESIEVEGEAVVKERDEHFNTIRPMFSTERVEDEGEEQHTYAHGL